MKAVRLPVPLEILKEAEYLAKHFGVETPQVILQTAIYPTYFPPKLTLTGRPLILLHPGAPSLMETLYHEFKHYLQIGEKSPWEFTNEEIEKMEPGAEEFAAEWYQKRQIKL